MSVEAFMYLLTLYAMIVTILLGLTAYSLMDAKRTIKLLGLAAEAKRAVEKCETSVKKTIAEADEIISKAKAKVKAAPKPRATTRKPAVTQRKIVTPKK